MPTGLPHYDRLYYGLLLGGFSHISGKAGQGKTTWVWTLLASMFNKVPCAYVSLEEDVGSVSRSLAAAMSGLDPNSLRVDPTLSVDLSKVERIRFFGRGVGWMTDSIPRQQMIFAEMDAACSRSPGGIVVVDNYSIIRNVLTTEGQKPMTDFAAASKVASEIMVMAGRNNCHVLLVNHISGGGGAYGKSRINPLSDVSWRCERSKENTELIPEKARSCANPVPPVLLYARGPNGLFYETGYRTMGRKKDGAGGF